MGNSANIIGVAGSSGTSGTNGTNGANTSYTTIEKDLGSYKKSGKFNITSTGLTIGKQVIILQATGPYTNKGTLADECQMDQIYCQGVVTSSTNIDVYWNSNTTVKGNFKFNYIINT